MLEQESKPETRPRRTLREKERRRVLRNRFMGAGVAVTLAIAAIYTIKRALPQWIAMPGNTEVIPVPAQQFKAVTPGAFASATYIRNNRPVSRTVPTVAAQPTAKNNVARAPLVVSNGLGPEILPVEKNEGTRRRRRRRRSTQQVMTPSPAAKPPANHVEATPPPTKLPTEAPAQVNSKPPDDVPDNP